METRQSVCALDCPDCCSLLVNVDEQGRGSRLRGNPDHPVTRGFLCGKVARYLERNGHPDRLMHPLRRTGAKGQAEFERISWDEALDAMASRFTAIADTHGSEAILPYSYAGTMGRIQGGGMDRRFFHRLGASRLDRTICSNAGGFGLLEALGTKLGTEPEQFVHSKLILAWGANIHGTNVHLWPFIVEARRRGAKLYTIDPIETRTAALADRHFPINPGSDLALALGFMHVIFRDELEHPDAAAYVEDLAKLRELASRYTPSAVEALTGIAASDVETLAREYATIRPAVIRMNYGLQRSDRGGRAFRAIASLPAIIGSWGQVGGGMQASTSGGFQFNDQKLQRPDLQLRSPLGREARLVNMSRLGTVLNETGGEAVHALFVYNSNPAGIAPNQAAVRRGLMRDDLFTVVAEHFITDTAAYADIVLPATTFLEHSDLYLAYGHYHVQMARPALPAPGETKPNTEIFRLLARRMGLNDPELQASDDELIRDALDTSHPYLEGITLERLERERSIRLNVAPPGEAFLPFAGGRFATPSGKCEPGPDVLDYVPPVESRHGAEGGGKFPLEMVSSKLDDAMNTTFGYRPEVDRETGMAHLHPEDASERGIADGDAVRVFNDRGSLKLTARMTPRIRRGVVRIPAVRWGLKAEDRQTVNVLTSERLTDIGEAATFYSCLVEVERCAN
jgi:anaerobic selenocysteine-containing dehydrogenase